MLLWGLSVRVMFFACGRDLIVNSELLTIKSAKKGEPQ
jgi:hypothetical protein